ncbi:unnamed protein product [Rotaria sordida]|uniref:Uncharacterized protein n=1 Tax=Rotaria sordida TaxID=392033 RepID=A0A815CCV0_9BILA|nr:unnamed protein product [Rotaria sordida]CAF3883777.1 unnamed protein product [Rotaria sordida]
MNPWNIRIYKREPRVFPTSSINIHGSQRKFIRFDSTDEEDDRRSNNNSSSLTVKVPKRRGIYYGWPLLVQGAIGNLTQAIDTFSQFDLIVF